jgi:hypothetical protein
MNASQQAIVTHSKVLFCLLKSAVRTPVLISHEKETDLLIRLEKVSVTRQVHFCVGECNDEFFYLCIIYSYIHFFYIFS